MRHQNGLDLLGAYNMHMQHAGCSSNSQQLKRLVNAHQAAATRLATGELQITKARDAAMQQIASHLRELRSELDAWCV